MRQSDVDQAKEIYKPSVSIEYRAVQQSTTVGTSKIGGSSLATSDTFARLQLPAAVGCFVVRTELPDGAKVRDSKNCQVLANLCVLQLYSQSSTAGSQCRLLRHLVDGEGTPYRTNSFYADGGYKAGLPWLFYLNGGSPKKASTVLHPKPSRVKFHASFTTTNRKYGIMSRLQFKLASYDIDGNFLGFSELAE